MKFKFEKMPFVFVKTEANAPLFLQHISRKNNFLFVAEVMASFFAE